MIDDVMFVDVRGNRCLAELMGLGRKLRHIVTTIAQKVNRMRDMELERRCRAMYGNDSDMMTRLGKRQLEQEPAQLNSKLKSK